VQGSEKSLNPVGKIAKKNNLKCVFVNSALKIPCNVTKILLKGCFFGDFTHCEESFKFLLRKTTKQVTVTASNEIK